MTRKKFDIRNENGTGKIQITEDIGWWETDSRIFTKKVDELIAKGVKDIEAYINTPGGNIFHANEIGNQIHRFTGKKKAKLGALCASSGTLIACYFDEVEACENCQYMIHDPISYSVMRSLEDFDSERQIYENLRNGAVKRYSKFTGLSEEEVSEMMRKTTWMNAEQAKAKGFVHRIVKGQTDTAPQGAMEQLKNYGHVPEVVNQLFNHQPKQKDMSKLNRKLGLPDTATEEQQMAAIDALMGAKDTLTNALVAMGEQKGLNAKHIKKLAASDPQATLELIADTKVGNTAGGEGNGNGGEGNPPDSKQIPHVSMADFLNVFKGGGNGKPADKEPAKLSELEAQGEEKVKLMMRTDPKKYAELYNAEYGAHITEHEVRQLFLV